MRTRIKFLLKVIKRIPMRTSLRNLVSWEGAQENGSEPGYTITIACMRSITNVVIANVQLLSRIDAANCKELVLVFDCEKEDLDPEVLEVLNGIDLPMDLVVQFYSSKQKRVAQAINWGWVFAWMSWSLAIGRCKTSHLILHDLDALALDPDFFEVIYQRALETGKDFHAIRTYSGSGVGKEHGLGTTFELVLKPDAIRTKFKPLEAFNTLKIVDGKIIDFDTLLWIQFQLKNTSVEAVDESQLVHPSQLICHYTDFLAGRGSMTDKQHSLMLMPYFSYLGGSADDIERLTTEMKNSEGDTVRLWGSDLPIHHLKEEHWAWMEKQIRRVEQTLFEGTRPIIEAYLEHFITRAGDKRTVGVEEDGVKLG
ncbi:hypothetical protein COB72_05935 [bacterium]|nr:MAG: hypothetical protein COB72_05935 [bacterium]